MYTDYLHTAQCTVLAYNVPLGLNYRAKEPCNSEILPPKHSITSVDIIQGDLFYTQEGSQEIEDPNNFPYTACLRSVRRRTVHYSMRFSLQLFYKN